MVEQKDYRHPIDPESVRLGSPLGGIFADGTGEYSGQSFYCFMTVKDLDTARDIISKTTTDEILVTGVGIDTEKSQNRGKVMYAKRGVSIWISIGKKPKSWDDPALKELMEKVGAQRHV